MQFLFTCYFIKKLQKGYFWIHYIQNPVKNEHLGQNVEPYLYIKLCHWVTFTSLHVILTQMLLYSLLSNILSYLFAKISVSEQVIKKYYK